MRCYATPRSKKSTAITPLIATSTPFWISIVHALFQPSLHTCEPEKTSQTLSGTLETNGLKTHAGAPRYHHHRLHSRLHPRPRLVQGKSLIAKAHSHTGQVAHFTIPIRVSLSVEIGGIERIARIVMDSINSMLFQTASTSADMAHAYGNANWPANQ